uniref:hypothetical protein n=1 Tax=Flavobacterium sp. TaxID=239 RepID=UPI00404885E4
SPFFFPKEYSFKDTIIYTFEGKLKEIIRLRDGFRKNNIYFDSNENKIKDISSTIDSPSIDKMNTYYFKSYKYDNNNNNILEEIEYEPITGNDTLKKIIYNSTEVKSITTFKNNLIVNKILQNTKKGINENNTYEYEFDSKGNVIKIVFTNTNNYSKIVLVERKIIYYE